MMAGDPKQLPPTVISDTGRAAALDQPLFERLQVQKLYFRSMASALSPHSIIVRNAHRDCLSSGSIEGRFVHPRIGYDSTQSILHRRAR